MQTRTDFGNSRWQLPHLILHPFSGQSGAGKLLESSRAALMLCGALANREFSKDDLARKVLEGRYAEIRMLYFLGKDLLRWMAQCVEFTASIQEMTGRGIEEQSFSTFLTTRPPDGVQAKLRQWGVTDFASVFSRAIGLNAVFLLPPDFQQLSEAFIRNYHRYADHLFACHQQLSPFLEIGPANFHFEIYASGEYSRILETQWSGDEGSSRD